MPRFRRYLPQTSSEVSNRSGVGNYFLPTGYRARSQPAFFADIRECGFEYQPGVYRRAARLGSMSGATVIVDVGCGRARKLDLLHQRFEVIGLDLPENIEYCRSTYSFGTWIEHDLELNQPLPIADELLRRSVVICADVIEHLVAPEKLLRALLRASADTRMLLISTPDRSRVTNEWELGPPTNESHTREWSRDEFAKLLTWSGFAGGYLTYTRSRTRSLDLDTLLYVRPGSRFANE